MASLCATLYKVVDVNVWYESDDKNFITDKIAIGKLQTVALFLEKMANLRVQLKDKWKKIFDEFTKRARKIHHNCKRNRTPSRNY